MPHILKDSLFLKRLVNAFLIRDPVASISSYITLDPEVTLDEIGLEAQWHHFSALKAAGGRPVVIRAEAVRADTVGTVARFWQAVGLPYSGAAFDWQTEKPKDWEQVGGWHGDVSSSQGIRPLTEGENRAQREKFEALAQAHPKIRDLLAHHQPFYERLAAEALA